MYEYILGGFYSHVNPSFKKKKKVLLDVSAYFDERIIIDGNTRLRTSPIMDAMWKWP